MAGLRLAACILVLALAIGGRGALAQQDGVFEYASASAAKVLIMGRTANLKVFPNKTSSEYLTLKFNRIEELDSSGHSVYGHAITSLSALTPTYSTGVRSAGDTDYTYVKMVFDSSQLKLPECPTPEKLAELGLLPAKKGSAAAEAAAAAKAAVPGGAQQQQLAAETGAVPTEIDAPAIKTLGDYNLAATIAALTDPKPPRRPEAMANKRHLLEANQHRTSRGGLLPRPNANGQTQVVSENKDPFAGIISTPSSTSNRGAVSVVTAPPSAPAVLTGSAPTITLTFFFGMTANKTFAYGKGTSVTVPADGLKFNIEASNWPFCSPLNQLRFDLAIATNMHETAQAQLTIDSIETVNPSAMITDIYSPPTRHLMQPMLGSDEASVVDLETAQALAARLNKQPKLPMKTAKLLVAANQAAAIECPGVAYPSQGSAINSTVSVALTSSSTFAPAANLTANGTAGGSRNSADSLGGSRLSLTFPYFETLYYDPVVYFGSIDGMQVADVGTQGNCTGIVCGRTAERRANAAPAQAAPRSGVAAALAAAALALVLAL